MKAWVTTIQLCKQIREECSTLRVRPVLETVLVVLYAKLAVKSGESFWCEAPGASHYRGIVVVGLSLWFSFSCLSALGCSLEVLGGSWVLLGGSWPWVLLGGCLLYTSDAADE